MNLNKLAACISIMTLTAASAFSQSSSEITPIKYEDRGGLFISFPVMDSISVKLLERDELRRENAHVWALYFNSQREKLALDQKTAFYRDEAQRFKKLFNVSETQNTLLRSNFDKQKELTRITKKKARRNGLILLGGGVTLGLILSLLL